ncbi:MAG: FKBP-type peptidyl-prolyl cis-trans isomerase [Desulfuromonadales bacterium]|nr:FKBP-type peptidyl-prolyl cis-trans isomerase [Desulfuromonadales bacterium]
MPVTKVLLLTLLCLSLALTTAIAGEQPKLDTLQKKISYAIGRQIGDSLRKSGLEIDLDIFAATVAETLAGTPDRLTDAEKMEVSSAMQRQQTEHAAKVTDENKSQGAAFLAENAKQDGIKVLESGLQYKVVTAGSGKTPGLADSVTVHYRGTLIDGTEFDSSFKRGQPVTFPVNGVIKGWTEALQLMQEGDKWQLFIPADLAYGERGAGASIGPHATLIFDVELIKVN